MRTAPWDDVAADDGDHPAPRPVDGPGNEPAFGRAPLGGGVVGGSGPFDRIVLPVGGGADEMQVQRWAVRLAARHGLPLRAVHVRTGPSLPPIDLFGYLEALCGRGDVPWSADVVEGGVAEADVVETLLGELHPGDLVVMGAGARSRADGTAGVAWDLAESAPCPVRVLKMG